MGLRTAGLVQLGTAVMVPLYRSLRRVCGAVAPCMYHELTAPSAKSHTTALQRLLDSRRWDNSN